MGRMLMVEVYERNQPHPEEIPASPTVIKIVADALRRLELPFDWCVSDKPTVERTQPVQAGISGEANIKGENARG